MCSIAYVLINDEISVQVDICLIVGTLFSDILIIGKWKAKKKDNTF